MRNIEIKPVMNLDNIVSHMVVEWALTKEQGELLHDITEFLWFELDKEKEKQCLDCENPSVLCIGHGKYDAVSLMAQIENAAERLSKTV